MILNSLSIANISNHKSKSLLKLFLTNLSASNIGSDPKAAFESRNFHDCRFDEYSSTLRISSPFCLSGGANSSVLKSLRTIHARFVSLKVLFWNYFDPQCVFWPISMIFRLDEETILRVMKTAEGETENSEILVKAVSSIAVARRESMESTGKYFWNR
jgi:hypothetical protein